MRLTLSSYKIILLTLLSIFAVICEQMKEQDLLVDNTMSWSWN